MSSTNVSFHRRASLASCVLLALLAVASPAHAFGGGGVWENLGNALAGEFGDPELAPQGDLSPRSETSLTLSNARAEARAFLAVSTVQANQPFKGGVMVPDFKLGTTVGFRTQPGQTVLGLQVMAPSGIAFFFQVWMQDPAAVEGFSASNALRGTTP